VVKGLSDPAVSVSDASVIEGNSGTTTLSFVVRLSAPAWRAGSVGFAELDESATSGSDYQSGSGTISFEPRATSATIDVTVIGDTRFEPDETLTLALLSPINLKLAKATATGTIRNDDPEPRPQWHRLNPDRVNPDRVNPTPQHERLECAEGSTWTCSYDVVAEPTLNLQGSSLQAVFIGSVIAPAQWICPGWFPQTCARASVRS
jgi:hypothetical protein